MDSKIRKPFSTREQRSFAIRPVAPNDTPHLVDLLTRLSERTRHLRYMAPRPMPPEFAMSEASRMVQGRTHQHRTLVALTNATGRHEAIGVAELICETRNPTQAELAVVVRDDYQGQGIGAALVKRLVRHAASSGIGILRADMLAENQIMLHMLRRLGLPLTVTTRYGETQVIAHVQSQFASIASIEREQREIHHGIC